MMKSDVLDGFDTIKACVAYTKDGVTTSDMPYDTEGWEPVYEDIPGWKTPLSDMRKEEEFPEAFKNYIAYLERELKTPIAIISVSPDRDATIIR